MMVVLYVIFIMMVVLYVMCEMTVVLYVTFVMMIVFYFCNDCSYLCKVQRYLLVTCI